MTEILDFLYESIPVSAARELLHELYEATEGSDYIKTQMEHVYTPWKEAYEVMAHVYELPIGNVADTNRIFSLDARRDLSFKIFELMVRLAKMSDEAEMVAAAEDMERMMVSFPVDTTGGYLSQTAQMDSFLAVALGERIENVTKVGALAIVQSMKADNDEIHAIVNRRDVLRVERDELPSRPIARQQAIDRWRFLAKFINGYVVFNYMNTIPEPLTQFIDLVNKKWERYESIYLGGATNKPGNGEAGDGNQGEGQQPGTGEQQPGEEQTPEGEKPGDGDNKPEGEKPNEGENGGSNNGNNTGNENNGNQQEEDDPNMPPPGSGGSGFE